MPLAGSTSSVMALYYATHARHFEAYRGGGQLDLEELQRQSVRILLSKYAKCYSSKIGGSERAC